MSFRGMLMKFGIDADGDQVTIFDPATFSNSVDMEGAVAVDAADLRIYDTADDHYITFKATSDEAANRSLNIPALGADDTLVTLATAQTFSAIKTWGAVPATNQNLGTVNGTGVAVTAAKGDGRGIQITLTLTNVDLALTDAVGVVAWAALKLYTMPAGAVLFRGLKADLDITKSSVGVNADWDGDIGFGTVTNDGDANLTASEQNLAPSTATPQAVAGVTTGDAKSTGAESGAVHGTTASPAEVWINVNVDDTDHDVTGTACNLIVNGTIVFSYEPFGTL